MFVLAALLCWFCAIENIVYAAAPYTPTKHGIAFAINKPGSPHVEIAVATSFSFRVSLTYNTSISLTALPSRMLSPSAPPPSNFTVITHGDTILGISTAFGAITVDVLSNTWNMSDESGTPVFVNSLFVSQPTSASIAISLGASSVARLYGSGGALSTVGSLLFDSAQALVDNRRFFVPYFYNTDGYGALGISSAEFGDITQELPVQYARVGGTIQFTYTKSIQGDLYLLPTSTMRRGTQLLYTLTGLPPVPPRYAFGFIASRWGWKSRHYIEDVLAKFRLGNFPLDAFICDFEWYTPEPDYTLLPAGSPTFVDFGYNNITFPDPIAQLKTYHDDFHVRFGGIRKPRLGNSDLLKMAASRGWLLGSGRNLNYSIPEVRLWYGEQLEHFLPDGVDFWWNDEGETQYFTFYDWNLAQRNLSFSVLPGKRFFSISRSYTPGVQRLGSTVWTGDTPVSWTALRLTAGYLLNWGLAGAAYITCDIGGFDGLSDPPDLLIRWYQLGVFLPIMRVHSWLHDLAHFPFLYPPATQIILREALNLRYQLFVYFYSLAHQFASVGNLLMRPTVMEYPDDPTTYDLSTQWLVGDILAAPVLNQDNTMDVYLPAGVWYEFNSTRTHIGPVRLVGATPLSFIPVYVRAGSVVAMASPGLQYTDMLPGGPLVVHVYPGSNCNFTVVEDDGETMAYANVGAAVRNIVITWNESVQSLSWTVDRDPLDSHAFLTIQAVAFFSHGQKTSDVVDLRSSGSIQF